MTAVDDLLALRPEGGFALIMADPPWSFRTWSAKGQGRSPSWHYATLRLEEIEALPVADLAARDCLLWLWTTNPHLEAAFGVLRAWGFRYSTAGAWAKRTKAGGAAMGGGYYLRSASEPFLIGRRGSPRRGSRSVRGLIDAPRREHSRKPDEAFAAAEALCPDGPRLELFARQTRPGWTCWGDEVGRWPARSGEGVA